MTVPAPAGTGRVEVMVERIRGLSPVARPAVLVPAVLVVGLVSGQTVVLGLAPTEMTLLVVTLILSTITFSGLRTTMLEGAVHLVMFFVYLVLIFSP